jgi:hypothetical protein
VVAIRRARTGHSRKRSLSAGGPIVPGERPVRIARMRRIWLLASVLAFSCGSDSSGSPNKSTGGGSDAGCPDIAGNWTVTQHCDSSLIGMSAAVTETNCSLSFAAPFDGFTGSIGSDGTVTLSGPQSCTGKPAADTISLSCTPGTCAVTLTRAK